MKLIPNEVSSKLALSVLKTRKHSPKIMFAAGIVGVVGTVVLASRATLRLDEVLEETQEKLREVDEIDQERFPGYTDEDRVKDKAKLYARGALDVTKLYAPAAIVGVASIGLLTGSHVVLSRRNAALGAAYAAVSEAFKEYRARVVEDGGEEKDRKYRYGIKKVDETIVAEDGTKKKVKRSVATGLSEYSRIYGPGLPNWQSNPELNLIFLRGIQNMCNDRLHANGYLFLNDVYDELGIDRTPAGQVVGWLRSDRTDGDGFVDFGIFNDENSLSIYDYVTGQDDGLLLDFNVDGVVYEKI